MSDTQSKWQRAKGSRISLFEDGFFRNGSVRGAGRRAQQAIAGVLAAAMLPMSLGTAWGQDGAPPPPPDYGNQGYDNQAPSNYQPLAPEQINQLVAPIALYPDSLVAQVLAASTYPAQLTSAEQFVQANGNYPPDQLAQLADQQPWDPSVKALVAFPQVLSDLNRNMGWTTQLGNVYYNQPQDVLGAVQTMRQRAYAAGNLRSTPQLAVNYDPGDIVIQPVSPAVVYVPYYNPWVVYGAPVPVYAGYYYGGPPRGIAFAAGLAIGFGVGIAIGAFTHFGWGYHNWAPNWGSRTVVFNHNTYISRSVTVVNHGYYGGFDRNPQARAFNQQQAIRYGGGSRTINNVTINRGGNTYNGGNTINRGGNTLNNGGNTINRGGQTYNSGGNTLNRGGQSFNNGGNTVNRGVQPYNNGANTVNRGAQPYNGGTNVPNRGVQPYNGGGTSYNRGAAPGGNQQFNRGNYTAPNGGGARPNTYAAPQNTENRGGGQSYQRPAAPQQQPQHSAPSGNHNNGGGGGGNHEHGGGGGHEDHHR